MATAASSASLGFLHLKAAYDQIPEFAERTDYDLSSRYAARSVWTASFMDSSPSPFVGFAAAHEKKGAFHLWLLGVRPDFRRKGIARDLLNCYLSEGARRGFTTFTVNTHAEAPGMVRLLESAGFSWVSLGLEVVEVGGESRARERLAFSLRK